MKKTLFIVACWLCAMAGFAIEQETFTHTPYCGEEGTNMRTYTTPHFRIEQFKGPNKSDSWADDEYEDLRLYKNQTLTITALEGVKRIDAVVFNVITVKTSSMATALSATYSAGVTPNDDGDDRCGLTFDGDITIGLWNTEPMVKPRGAAA